MTRADALFRQPESGWVRTRGGWVAEYAADAPELTSADHAQAFDHAVRLELLIEVPGGRRVRAALLAPFSARNLAFTGIAVHRASVSVPSGPNAWLRPQVRVCAPLWAIVANGRFAR